MPWYPIIQRTSTRNVDVYRYVPPTFISIPTFRRRHLFAEAVGNVELALNGFCRDSLAKLESGFSPIIWGLRSSKYKVSVSQSVSDR